MLKIIKISLITLLFFVTTSFNPSNTIYIDKGIRESYLVENKFTAESDITKFKVNPYKIDSIFRTYK